MVIPVDDDNEDDIMGMVNQQVVLGDHLATVRSVKIGSRVLDDGTISRKAFCQAVYYTFESWQPPAP